MRLDIRRSKDGSRRQSDTDKEVDLMRRELKRMQRKGDFVYYFDGDFEDFIKF